MEWAPKLLDNLDSAVLAFRQSLAGYYRWVFLRLILTVVAVSALVFNPTLRILAIAVVTGYVAAEIAGRLLARHRQAGAAPARSRAL